MIIGVQRGLMPLKQELEDRGYKVVYTDEYSHPVDAFIFSGFNTYHPFSSFPEAGTYMNVMGNITNISHGDRFNSTIEINAAGKSIDEIEVLLYRNKNGELF